MDDHTANGDMIGLNVFYIPVLEMNYDTCYKFFDHYVDQKDIIQG